MAGSPRRVAAIGSATADAFGGADLVAGGLDPGGPARGAAAACRPRALRRRGGGAAAARRRARRDVRAALPDASSSTPPSPPPATSSCSRPPPRRGPSAGSASPLPAVSIGPQTTAAARERGRRGRRRSGDARPRGAPRGDNLSRVFVTFLSDFGLQDDFVGTCHGVIKRIAPDAEIIDVTHGIPPQQVLQGALVLANTLPYMPVGVHLAVVDPGVGGSRRALALRDKDGRFFVGPDNGLLIPAAERAGIEAAHELVEPRIRARLDLAHVPRPRPVRARGRPSLARRRDRGARPSASRSTRSSGSTCRSRSFAPTGSPRPSSTSTPSATSRST